MDWKIWNKFKWKKYKTRTKNKFDWKKIILGLKRPAIVIIGTALTYLSGIEQWSWVGGIAIERVWATVEFYLRR